MFLMSVAAVKGKFCFSMLEEFVSSLHFESFVVQLVSFLLLAFCYYHCISQDSVLTMFYHLFGDNKH